LGFNITKTWIEEKETEEEEEINKEKVNESIENLLIKVL
jgi:hypothetical protein